MRSQSLKTWRSLLILTTLVLVLSACNLNENAPSEPLDDNTILTQQAVPASDEVVPLDDAGTGVEGQVPIATATLTPIIPATDTPAPAALPNEVLGPITIEGTELRSLEPITIRITRGKSVGNVTCTAVLQDTGQATSLGAPTTQAIDDNTEQDVYTFTPDSAGTFAISCNGVVTSGDGTTRAVSAAGNPFVVEAKG